MPAKKTFEQWVEEVEATHGNRYECLALLPKAHTQEKARLLARCSVHGEFEIAALSLATVGICPKCRAEELALEKRKPLSEWVRQFEGVHGSNYQYLEIIYVKGRGPDIAYLCEKHGRVEQVAHSHLKGCGCPSCSVEQPSKKRIEYSEWIERFNRTHGDRYVYEGVSYDSGKAKVSYLCEDHGKVTQLAALHESGSGCPSCGAISRAAKSTLTFEGWADKFSVIHSNKYKYLAVKDVGGVKWVDYLCKKHGKITQAVTNHANHGCKLCGVDRRSEGTKLGFDGWCTRFVNAHESRYKYIEMVYRTGEAAEVRYECEKHGEVLQLASDHIRYGCGKCSPSGVMGNKHTTAISESLGLLGLSTLDEHRIGSSRKRWDVVVPDANIAVEFDGIYYHSEKFKSDKSYMRTKAAEAQLNGYRQINIWEDEWHNKKEIVKRLLASACGKSTEPTIYARKTSIVELEKTDVQKFIDDNHIQGFGSGSHYLGLKSGDSLVACMVYSYKGAGRSTKVVEDCVDIQRYATSCHVVGGFQKLLKHILLDEKVKAVISYSDPRLFTGVMYEKAGFVASPEGGPDYCYVKGSKRIPKRARQKSWFKGRDGVLYDPTLTEYELALLNGYQRLWFRGKVKWALVR